VQQRQQADVDNAPDKGVLRAERVREIAEALPAVVAFYGTRRQEYAAAQASYLGHFAEHDPYVTASGLRDLVKSLRKAGRPATLHTYAGTGHWFFERERTDAYNCEAAELAWQRTLRFLGDLLVNGEA